MICGRFSTLNILKRPSVDVLVDIQKQTTRIQ